MRQSEGMLEVIEQVGVANGDHQGKSFSLRSLITSTFILHGSGDCCVGCMEHSPYTTTTFGNYLHTCTLARMLTLLCTHTHTHTHTDAPDVTTTVPSPHLVPRGTTLTLSCDYDSVPPPTITWLHNGSPLSPTDPRVTISSTDSQSTLMHTNLGENEGGTYICNASNVVGSNSVDISVQGCTRYVCMLVVFLFCVCVCLCVCDSSHYETVYCLHELLQLLCSAVDTCC